MKTALKLSAALILGVSGLTAASAAAYAQDETGAAEVSEQAKSERRHGPRRGHGEARLFERLADDEGVITREAFLERHEQRFDRMDVDGDGVVTDADREALREQWSERRAEGRAEWAERRAERGEDASERTRERRQRGGDRHADLSEEERTERREQRRQAQLERIGADADGNITREAFLERGDALFDRLAGEGENEVTLDELRERASEWREHRREDRGERGHRGRRG